MMLNDELTNMIVSAVVGAISGGFVSLLLDIRKDRRNDKKDKIKEKQNIQSENSDTIYILNTNTMKFHNEGCSSAKDIKPKIDFTSIVLSL